MKVFFYTLGCKVNQYETQAMRRLMEEEGYETAEYTPGKQMPGDAVIVVNSCTVTGESDHKLRKLLRRCRRENPQAVLVLTGCMRRISCWATPRDPPSRPRCAAF